jgi:cell division protein FtsQ
MALLLALAAFPQSALFTVERIEVTGAVILTPASVIAIAGLKPGDRLFSVDAARTLKRLLADPRIQTGELHLRPPSTVSIAVTERKPVVALLVGDRFALLAEDLTTVALSDTDAGLPEVSDHVGKISWARPGGTVVSAGASIAIRALPSIPSALRSDVKRIVVTPGGDITFMLRSGLEIRAGGLLGLTERLVQAPQILDALRARNLAATVLDLRYAGSVVVRLLREEKPGRR